MPAFIACILLLPGCGERDGEAEESSVSAPASAEEGDAAPDAADTRDPSGGRTGEAGGKAEDGPSEDAGDAAPPPVPPLTKSSLREHPLGRAWVFEGGKPVEELSTEIAEARGYTLISLGDDWVPFIFTEQTPGLDDASPNNFAARYRDLANDRTDADGDALAEHEHNYLEHYGIPPSVSVVWAEWQSVESTVQPCLDAAGYDPTVFASGEIQSIDYDKRDAQKRLQKLRWAESRLDREMQKAKVPKGDYEAASKVESLGPDYRAWRQLQREVAIIRNAQVRLDCERLFDTKDGRSRSKSGEYDNATTHALANFERKHAIMGWGHFNEDNLVELSHSALESVHGRLLRVVRERVVSGAGILEDGSARDWKPEFTYEDAQGETHPLRDVLTESVDATVEALGLQTPESAHAALTEIRKLGGGDFDQFLVAVKLPDPPAYYSEDMAFEAEIDRGDVWYDFPYDEEGNKLGQPRRRYPHLTLWVRYRDQRIPLIHWRTTIGSWRTEMHEGQEWFAYKNSDVGERVWKDIMAAPAWIPPESTPVRTLVKRKYREGRWQDVVNYDETGPGYQSAYGLVAAYHIRQVLRDDGTVRAEIDNQIRTHGSVDYMSIMRRYSHGCHRLYNMNAVRMFSFILQHRPYLREGQVHVGYRRIFEYKEQEHKVAIDTRGYRYRLETPIPVNVLEGRIRGTVLSPIEEMRPKPGVEYGVPAPTGGGLPLEGDATALPSPPPVNPLGTPGFGKTPTAPSKPTGG